MTKDIEIVGPKDLPNTERLEEQIRDLEKQNKALYDALRFVDEKIWLMSQQPSWDRMRPLFQTALEATNERKNIEHKRINDLLIPELKKVYGQ